MLHNRKSARSEMTVPDFINGNWFSLIDNLMYNTLHPTKRLQLEITAEEAERIRTVVDSESLKVLSIMQNQLLSIKSKKEGEILIGNYHSSFGTILRQLSTNLALTSKDNIANKLLMNLISRIEETISLIESRFSIYLDMDEYVSTSYFRAAQAEIGLRLKKLQARIPSIDSEKAPFEIVHKKLFRFLSSDEYENNTSYKDVLFKRKLLSEIEKIDFSPRKVLPEYSHLDKVLIYLNFNSVEYIDYLVDAIQNKIGACNDANSKAGVLIYFFKLFNQLHKATNFSYNKRYHSIENIMTNWFSEELLYLEKTNTGMGYNLDRSVKLHSVGATSAQKKVMCMLSSDQIGLIIRAADDLRILISKSMSEVFKSIVPHLSTQAKETLSYDGMRSKSYVAEERDKKIAIEALEQIIEKIKSF